MKNNKVKAKKGMTLIEVIISVALLSILMVPISSLVMSSLKNNIDAEDMQKASYIGQKVLEELKAYDEVKLEGESNEKYFKLLDGDKITQVSDGEFLGSFDRTIYGSNSESIGKNEDIYKVEVSMSKDSIFNENINNINNYDGIEYKLEFSSNSGFDTVQLINMDSKETILSINSEDLILDLDDKNNLKIYKKSNKEEIPIKPTIISNNKILLYLHNNYKQITNIDIKNSTNKIIEVYLFKEKDSLDKLNLISSKGNIVLYEENEVDKNKFAIMYNYKVIVKDKKDNILFQGSSSNNVNIK